MKVEIEFADADDLLRFTRLAAKCQTETGTPGNLWVALACSALRNAKVTPKPDPSPFIARTNAEVLATHNALKQTLAELEEAHAVHVWPEGDEGHHAPGTRAKVCAMCRVILQARTALNPQP